MEKPIPIAHIFLTLKIGGMEKVGIDLIEKLDPRKYENHIICLDELGSLGQQLVDKGYSIAVFHKGMGFKVKVIWKLVRYFKKNHIKIVHTNNPAPHFWGGIAAWLAGVKVRIHTKHGRNFSHMPRRVLLNRFSAFFSTKVITVSGDVARLTIDVEKVPRKKVKIIYNGIDVEHFKDDGFDQSYKKSLGFPMDSYIIGSIARFNRDKDFETLVEAFAKIYTKYPHAWLLLVGGGETLSDIKQLVNDLGLNQRVIFTGYRSDIKELLSLMDMYVLSTHTEGISISLLEALAMEKPAIATNVGGNGEIIEDRQNGILVPENDSDALAQSMATLIDNPELAREYGRKGRETVIEKFSLQNLVKEYEAIYREGLQRG